MCMPNGSKGFGTGRQGRASTLVGWGAVSDPGDGASGGGTRGGRLAATPASGQAGEGGVSAGKQTVIGQPRRRATCRRSTRSTGVSAGELLTVLHLRAAHALDLGRWNWGLRAWSRTSTSSSSITSCCGRKTTSVHRGDPSAVRSADGLQALVGTTASDSTTGSS